MLTKLKFNALHFLFQIMLSHTESLLMYSAVSRRQSRQLLLFCPGKDLLDQTVKVFTTYWRYGCHIWFSEEANFYLNTKHLKIRDGGMNLFTYMLKISSIQPHEFRDKFTRNPSHNEVVKHNILSQVFLLGQLNLRTGYWLQKVCAKHTQQSLTRCISAKLTSLREATHQ